MNLQLISPIPTDTLHSDTLEANLLAEECRDSLEAIVNLACEIAPHKGAVHGSEIIALLNPIAQRLHLLVALLHGNESVAELRLVRTAKK